MQLGRPTGYAPKTRLHLYMFDSTLQWTGTWGHPLHSKLQFSSSSQWARASTRPASANMSINDDVSYITWKQENENRNHQHVCSSSHGIPPRFFHTINIDKHTCIYKVPPSRAYSSTAPVKDGVSSESELAARYLHAIRHGTAEMDKNSRRKQAAKAKAEKEAASGTPGDITTRKNTYAFSSVSRFTSTMLTARPFNKTASISSTSSSAPLRNVISDFAPNESFSMHVDDILPPPKHAVGRIPSIVMDTSLTISSSNFGSMPPSKTLAAASTSASTAHPSATQRGPPPLGMRRQHNLPDSGFPLSQSRYATTQSPYAASQAKGQKPVMLPPFKPLLLKKPNSIPTSAPKQVFQTPESPPTSTPELVKDDSNDDGDDEEDKLGAAGADSLFDVSFDVDVDALEATMRQYD
ncbi:hypothetical protein BDR06DRAFT_1024777 [Suillus hirtellus]|nr:hypothetical protein BDR06DRAFT_1024777 [Suillus hirtellus]